MKLLLTGAGSLIGLGIHEALTDRKGQLEIIGANLEPDDPIALMCDRVYPLPPDSEPGALAQSLRDLTAHVAPDLVLPCRDPHIAVLAELQDRGQLTGHVPLGPASLTPIMVDKWEAYLWCEEGGLPFTPTVLSGGPQTWQEVDRLIVDFGFPLIAKPRAGSGSLGVRVVTTTEQARRVCELPDTAIQPFLDPPAPADLELDSTRGAPLFWEVPVRRQYTGQFLIGPDGTLGPGIQMYASLRLGRNEYVQPWHDEGLQELLERTVAVLAEAGWRGPLNVQARPHAGRWYIMEFGGRFTGGTSQRTLLGFDEVGWILNAWAGRRVVPPLSLPPASQVYRFLADCPVWDTSDGVRLSPDAKV